MEDWLHLGEPALQVRLRRNLRARRLVLRVPASGGPPVLTAPPAVALRDVRAFALEHEGWLQERLAARPAAAPLVEGAGLPVAGRIVRLGLGRRLRYDPVANMLDLPGPALRLPPQAAAFLRARAHKACLASVERYAARLGRSFNRLSLRDPRARWGSCSSRGDLMFSWRLAMAPHSVLDYVAAHEVAHLAEMNHSPRFWALVERLRPDYASPRAWLRRHGAGLHRFDFSLATPGRGEGA